MSRLTIKNSDGSYSQPTHTTFEKMFYKLAEFEDFMEREEFTNLEDLKAYIKLISNGSKELMQYNQALKDRWEKLKEYINGFKEYNIEEANLAWKITDKMQELEQEKL